MSRHRSGLVFSLGLALAAATTSFIVLLSWRAFTMEPEATVPLLYTGLLVAVIGATARWLRVPAALLLPVQVVVAAVCVLGWVTGSPLPTPTTVADFVAAFEQALSSARQFRAPVPVEAPAISPILIAAGAGVLVVVDALVGGLRRVPLAGLVLLAVYSVPVSITGSGLTWVAFVALAVGFMAMLYLVHFERVTRWGRGVGVDRTGRAHQPDHGADEGERAGFSVRTGAVVGSAVTIGTTATALALLLPVALPSFDLTLFDGAGPGKREIEVADPLVDLRRDLDRGEDIPLLEVTTPQRDPSYLRLAALTNFNGTTWTPGDRDIPDDQLAQGRMPRLAGVASATERTQWPYRVEVSEDFESRWLPTTPQVAAMAVDGDWRYDTSTMDFMTTDPDVTTAGMDYSFTGVAVQPDPELMDDALSGVTAVSAESFEVPPSVTGEIRSLAAEVTKDESTRFRKAQALQQWFREDGGFVYSIENIDEVSEGTLSEFLDESGRVGYCEQFAASMAIMARVIGIPARVAVGFLNSQEVGPNTYEFSSHDLHAWPELFFPGAGWVRFEPTPGDRAAAVPGYTSADLAANPSLDPAPESTQSNDARSRQLRDPETTATGAGGDTSFPWLRLVLLAGAVALLLVLVLAPALVRRRRRERRLLGDLEDLWRELRDHVTDLGHQWPAGRSPRRTGAWLAARFGAPTPDGPTERPRTGPDQAPDAVQALDRLVEQLERARYSRSASPIDNEQAGQDVLIIESALEHGVGPRARRRARWLPRSLRGSGPTPAREVVAGQERSTGAGPGATMEAVGGQGSGRDARSGAQ